MTETIFKLGNFEVRKDNQNITMGLFKDNPDKKADISTIGVSGNTGREGVADTGEYLENLDGYTGRTVYDQMRRSDGQVGAVLQAIILPIRQANYFIEPASEDPKDIEIAEQTAKDFLENMTITWDDVIRHACLMFPFGFSVLEKIWEVRDGRVVPRKLDPRLPQSIFEWVWNDGKDRLTGPKQVDTNGDEITLPIEKILVFTVDREGDNWEGKSILRNAYKSWYIKDQLEKINAIKHDRHGVGIPVMEVPQSVKDGDEQWNNTETILQNIQANEQGYVITPEGYTFSIVGGGGDKGGTDALPSINYYDEMIARSVLAMYLNLGTTDTGSRALGESFVATFLMSLQAYADYICSVITRFAIREYVDFNWTVTDYPTLKVRRIKQLDPVVIAELVKARVITPDLDVENTIRKELDYPEKLEEEEPEEEPLEPDESQNSHNHKHVYQFAEGSPESLIDFDTIEKNLNKAEDVLLKDVIKSRNKQASSIIQQLIGGRKIQNVNVPEKKNMHESLIFGMNQQIKAGKKEVRKEIEDQLSGKKTLAELPPDKEFLADMIDELSLKVEGSSDKLKSIIGTTYFDLKKRGLEGKELEAAIIAELPDRVSDQTWKLMSAGAVNGGWGYGRRTGAEGFEDKIDYAYYSAVLDSNTCVVCADAAAAGTEHEPNDPEFITPNPQCRGGDNCRCLTIYVMKEESE